MHQRNLRLFILFICFVFSRHTYSQLPNDTMIALKDAVQLGEQRYHLLKARKYEADAAERNKHVVKYGRLPIIDASYQANLATANNLIGMFYPSGILPITGPPSLKNDYHPATGSAASVLLNWQAITFGEQNAKENLAQSQADSKQLEWKREVFMHKINVISSYLDLLLAYDQANIHIHNIERIEANLKESRVLVNTGIRPGVDSALFLTELSRAKVERLNAIERLKNNQYLLAKLIVSNLIPEPLDTNFIHRLPGIPLLSEQEVSTHHPYIKYSESLIEVNQLSEELIKKSYLPKLTLWVTAFARGSGFYPNTPVKTIDGLGLSRYNYGAGLQLSFSILKYGEVQRQLQRQAYFSKSSEEMLENEKGELIQQLKIANSTFTSSLDIAKETQQQLKDAQYAFMAMQVRYNTGLVNFSDLIQTDYNLLKAELDLKNAFWNGWKALLLLAAVKGDESIFLNEIK